MLLPRLALATRAPSPCARCLAAPPPLPGLLRPSSPCPSRSSPRPSPLLRAKGSRPLSSQAPASRPGPRRPAASAAWTRAASSNAPRPSPHPPAPPPTQWAYAHEDLLLPSSTAPAPSARSLLRRPGTGPRSLRSSPSSPSPSPPAYFSPSYLLAQEPPLPPPSTSPLVPLSAPIPTPLPPPLLATGLPNPAVRWRALPSTTVRDDLALYKQLGKFKLSSLVVLTTMAGYAMCPVDPTAAHAALDALAQSLGDASVLPSALDLNGSPASATTPNHLTLSVLLPVTVGTTLCAFSAAAFNQLIEAPYDAQMARTRARPLPKRVVTPLHAATYGALTGTVGLATLLAVNPLSAALGLFTIVLYCPLYTISKRHTIYNTWLGAVVGAVPPLIGWAACTNSIDPLTQPGAWALFGLLYAWQFPHFMSLAHTLRSSYASSGYRMLAVLDPRHNALVSLRYSLALLPLCAAFPALGLTHTAFAWLSLAPNGLLALAAWRFWRRREDRRAKELFWASLIQLPVVLALAMVCKKGLWGDETGAAPQQQEDHDEPISADRWSFVGTPPPGGANKE